MIGVNVGVAVVLEPDDFCENVMLLGDGGLLVVVVLVLGVGAVAPLFLLIAIRCVPFDRGLSLSPRFQGSAWQQL